MIVELKKDWLNPNNQNNFSIHSIILFFVLKKHLIIYYMIIRCFFININRVVKRFETVFLRQRSNEKSRR